MSGLLLLFSAFAILAFWKDSVDKREQVIEICTRLTKEIDVQLLDQTAHLMSLRLTRDGTGRIVFRRSYQFECSSSGVDRFTGLAILTGKTLTHLQVDTPEGPLILAGKDQLGS